MCVCVYIYIYIYIYIITLNGRRKKIKKSRKQKNITEKSNTEKKPIKILKNLVGSVRFRFYKPEIEKLNRIHTKKPKKTNSYRKKPGQTKKTEPKLVGLNWFQFFFKKKSVLLLIFDKNRTESKIITPI